MPGLGVRMGMGVRGFAAGSPQANGASASASQVPAATLVGTSSAGQTASRKPWGALSPAQPFGLHLLVTVALGPGLLLFLYHSAG